MGDPFTAPNTAVILASSTMVYDNIARVLKVSDQAGTYREFEYADATLATRALKTTFSGGSGVTRVKIAEEEQDENGNVLSSKTFDAGLKGSGRADEEMN